MPNQALLDSRYRILRTIGSGGMGVVYLVVDTSKENKIMALKISSTGHDPYSADEFKSEFRSIRGVQHPHIPEVYDFGMLAERDNALYFTTEFIDGQPLNKLNSEWTPEQLREILVSLCRALAFLHSRSLLHRDIKPENVLGRLDENGRFTLLKLVDFGLAAISNKQSGELSGTLDYLAPEVIRGDAHTENSDLYSLGLLLYRLAAGTLPFADQDPMTAAKLRSQTELPSLLRYRSDFPVGLADVISAMIRLKAKDRPPSPRHVIALLNEREGTEYPYETADSSRAYIRSATFVTNREARQILAITRESLLRGAHPESIFLRSLPGMGRSSLIKNFQSELTLSGISCRTVNTTTELPAAQNCPRVVFVPEISKLDYEILCGSIHELAPYRVLWILGGRQLPETCDFRLNSFRILDLKPLNTEGVKEFVQTTFPENSFPDSFFTRLYSGTLGISSALQAALKSLQENELLRIGLFGWELLPGEWKHGLQDDVSCFVQTKMASLSSESQDELQLLACSSVPLPDNILNQAVKILRKAAPETKVTGNSLTETGWIDNSDSGRLIRFDAVRESISQAMSPETAKAMHSLLRSVWQTIPAPDEALREREVLYHDFRAESWQTPGEDADRILQQAIDKGLLAWARELLIWCVKKGIPRHLKTAVYVALSRIEYIKGDTAQATELLSEILDRGQAEVTPANLSLVARYANLEEKLGRTDNAEKLLDRTLEVLTPENSTAAASVYGTLAWIAFKKGDQEKAAQLAEAGLSRVPFDAADPGFALLLNTFATLAFYKGDSDTAAAYWQRCMEVSQKLGDRKNIANMYNNLGVLAAQSGDRIRARQLWEQCAEIAQDINDIHRLAGIYNNLGVDALETGQLREAEEYYLKSLTLFRRMRGPREQVELLSNLGELSYYRADYPRAQAFFREALDLAAGLGDKESQIEPMVYLGKLLITLDHLEQAENTLTAAQQIAHDAGVKKGEGQALEGLAVLYARNGMTEKVNEALELAHKLMPNDVDPLAAIHLNLTECRLRAEKGELEAARNALNNARQVADIKWDPYTAARTEVYGLLFAHEQLDEKQLQFALRKLNVFPDFLWGLHWAVARENLKNKTTQKALEEFGKGVTILKAITARLPEQDRESFLNSPLIRQFKSEALDARKLLKAD
ncbi:serine/threonine-protein kinase [bacterium]|nr:serine/threonine-protein kinase [bacterium]MBU1638808.1 serine/threonine-protein kinase [bacterium]